MAFRYNLAVANSIWLLGNLFWLSGCAAVFEPKSERESATVLQKFEGTGEIDASQLALAIRRWDPTDRVGLFRSLFMTKRVRSIEQLFAELKSMAVRDNDLILLGDLEFCKNYDGEYTVFKTQLAREEGGRLPFGGSFYRELGAEVALARENALRYYLSAGDYLGASFVESEMSGHTEIGMDDQAADHIRRALEYLARSKKDPKRAMPGVWWFHLIRGTYEGELRGRLKEFEAKPK